MYVLMYIYVILAELVEKGTIGGRGSAHHNGQLSIYLHQKLCVMSAPIWYVYEGWRNSNVDSGLHFT